MTTTRKAIQVLDRQFLEMRCGLLDLAAAMDRISRSENASDASRDPRMELIEQGLRVLASGGTDRAERMQLLFSDQYVEGWNRK